MKEYSKNLTVRTHLEVFPLSIPEESFNSLINERIKALLPDPGGPDITNWLGNEWLTSKLSRIPVNISIIYWY